MDQNPWANSGRFDLAQNQQNTEYKPEQPRSSGSINQNYTQSYNQSYNQNYNQGYNQRYNDASALKKKAEKKQLRKISLYSGGALLLVVLIQNVLVVALAVIGQLNLYLDNEMFQSSFDIFLMVLGMLLPFMLMGRKMKKVSGEINPVPLNKPTSAADFFLAVVAGLGICFAANFVTSIVTVALALFGLEPSAPEIAMPEGPLGVALSFARIAVIAGVIEELCLRGYVMGNLRKYGDGFAILMSAFVFGFMHGNLIQAPFALVAGVGLGYLSVKTNSLWTGMVIHTLNNGVSVLFTYLYNYLPEETVNIVYVIFLWAVIFVGMIALLLFCLKTKNFRLRKNQSSLSFFEASRSFLLSPTMIVSMLYMIYVTANFISKLE